MAGKDNHVNICVTAQGDQLESQVDPRFGRCQYFLLIDTETMGFEAFANPNVAGMGGVGVQSGQFVADKQAQAVLTGKVGPNASQALKAAGIDVFVNVDGDVRSAVERFKNGELSSSDGPNAQEKSGMNG